MEIDYYNCLDFADWYRNGLSNNEISENIEDDFNKWREITGN